MEKLLQSLFWIIFSMIIYTFIAYPIILLILIKIKGKFKINKKIDGNYYPTVTLLISAFNEQEIIREKILNSLDINYDKLEIIVLSDGSTDDTVCICQEFEPEIKLIHFEKNEGKNITLNKALKLIKSEIIVFSDANTFYQKDTIQKMIENFSDVDIGCIGGRLLLTQTDGSNTSKGEGLYWRYEDMLKKLESSLGTLLSVNGGVFAARKNLIHDLEPDVPNDFQIPMNIGAKGYNIVYIDDAIAYEKTTTHFSEEVKRKMRIVNRTFTGYLKLKNEIRGIRLFEMVSHKLIRWFIGIFAFLILFISLLLINNTFYLIILILQIIFYLLALLGYLFHSNFSLIYTPFYISIILISSTIGIIKVFLGKNYTKWLPSSSSR